MQFFVAVVSNMTHQRGPLKQQLPPASYNGRRATGVPAESYLYQQLVLAVLKRPVHLN